MLGRSYAYFSLGQYPQAIDGYTEAIDTNYTETVDANLRRIAAYIGRALSWREMNEPKKAIADFDRAIELGSDDTWIYFYRGSLYQETGQYREAIADFSRVIDSRPKDVDSLLGRAEALATIGEWRGSLADFNRVIEIEPNSSFYRAARGTAFLKHDEFEKGIADILAAIRMSPKDLGNDFRATTNKELPAASLAHGEQQVRNMLRDRPAMAEHVMPGDQIWNWAVRKFAGEDLGALVDWNPTEPAPFQGASGRPAPDQHAQIMVSKVRHDSPSGREASFDELWQSAVFELYNVLTVDEHVKLEQLVADSKLSRDDFVLKAMASEDPAAERHTGILYQLFFAMAPFKGNHYVISSGVVL